MRLSTGFSAFGSFTGGLCGSGAPLGAAGMAMGRGGSCTAVRRAQLSRVRRPRHAAVARPRPGTAVIAVPAGRGPGVRGRAEAARGLDDAGGAVERAELRP